MKRPQRQQSRRPSTDAGHPNELPLPHATRAVFPSRVQGCRNVGLLFDRYLRFQPHWQLGTYRENRRDRSAKLFNIEEVAKTQERCKQDVWWQEMYRQFVARWKESAQLLGVEPFPMTPKWRFVLGLGDKGSLEVGLTFHRIYGFPVIPGSALKGLTRAAALWETAEVSGIPTLPLHEAKERAEKKRTTPLEKLEAALLAYDERVTDPKTRAKMREEGVKALQALKADIPGIDQEVLAGLISQFCTVFGTLHAAGQAVFLDGVPAKPPTLEPDVMNVHYADYYQDTKPPADYLNPTPIPFLTVAGDSPFLFAVGWRGPQSDEAHHQAIKWLKKGLSELGVGAKTAAGYGYFEEVK